MTVHRVALCAGRGVVPVTNVAVAGAEISSMLHMQFAERTALEAVVAGFALTEGLAQRAAWDTGNVTGLAVITSEGVMVHVPIAGTVTEIMHHLTEEARVRGSHLVALDAGRGIVSMTGVAVSRSVSRGMFLVELAERSALEAGVAGFALTEGLTQRAAWDTGNVTGFAVITSEGVMVYVSIAGTVTEIMHHLSREIR